MHEEVLIVPEDRLEARPDDPALGVHALSQFAYCARAGLCAFETQTSWEEAEPAPANVDYLPRYEWFEIERRFEATLQQLLWSGCLALLGALVTLRLPRGLLVDLGCASVFLLFFVVWVIPRLLDLSELARRHRTYRSAKPVEVDPARDEPQPVHWCGLLKAGYLSVDYPQSLRHQTWKLCGQPWRVLRRGNQRIPVFKQPQGDALHHKHLVKAAAYCHLLRTVENAESPFAVVLQEESFDGLAIPFNVQGRKRFHEALRQARRVVRDAQKGNDPAAPERESLCVGCPYGKPVPLVPGQSEHHKHRVALPVFAAVGAEPTVFHSHCGDRFGWVPPHARARDKDLRPVT